MSGPEEAAPVTPGQAARAAYGNLLQSLGWETFASDPASVHPDEWEAWEAAAKAVEARTPGGERVAELVTEVNELRAQLREADHDHAELIDTILKNDPYERDGTARTSEDIAIEYVRELEHIIRARHAPAVVTAGTEHLAEKIRDLTIPDEES